METDKKSKDTLRNFGDNLMWASIGLIGVDAVITAREVIHSTGEVASDPILSLFAVATAASAISVKYIDALDSRH